MEKSIIYKEEIDHVLTEDSRLQGKTHRYHLGNDCKYYYSEETPLGKA